MPTLIDLLRSRRSIRLFRDHPLDDDQLRLLQESLVRSPTSRGRNPWQFVVVDDSALLQQVARAKMHGSAFLANAALAFVICADESVSDVWIEDCAIAAVTLQYTAHSIGLGSCWAQIRLREHDVGDSAESYLQKLLGIPDHIRVASVIGVGHPAEEKQGHPFDELPPDRFHRNGFAN